MEEKCRTDKAGNTPGTEEAIEILNSLLDQVIDNSNNGAGADAARIGETVDLVKRLEDINAATNYPTNDLGSARLFADIFKDRCRYSPTSKDWMYYDGIRWIRDLEGMKARGMCKALADAVLIYATYSQTIDADKRKEYLKYGFSLSSSRVRNTVVNDARDENSFVLEDCDTNDFIINLPNCTLDLRQSSPVCREHDPDDLLTKVAGANYDSQATCPLWEQTIAEIMEDDAEKIRYLQKLLGVCLTGDTSQEEMYFLYGSTSRNGKSTITETALFVLGDYAQTINPETLAIRNNSDSRTASPDLAKLAGARLVIASEPPKRMLFDAARAKTLTGRDRIVARYLHENEFAYIPKFKLLFNTNYLPSINDPTVFMSGRVRVIEFNRHFTEAEQDKTLKDKLRAEASGILNWMIKGYQKYRQEGLIPPGPIREATADYAKDSDKLGRFIEDCLAESPGRNCNVTRRINIPTYCTLAAN